MRRAAPLLMNWFASVSEYEFHFSFTATTQRTPVMREPDRYETRARELALAAGVDPDSRIERPGQRSMPAWCAYRDAARKEHLAAEAAEAERSIAANSPQAPQYANSPLRVFGRHDDATIAQMCNCMAVGNVAGGSSAPMVTLVMPGPSAAPSPMRGRSASPASASISAAATWPYGSIRPLLRSRIALAPSSSVGDFVRRRPHQ